MQESHYRVAPPGFTESQWETFMKEGLLLIENALSPEETERYREAILRVREEDPAYDGSGYYARENIVERHPVLSELIDHPRHVGFAYDLYGELLKLHQSQAFCRPPGGNKYNLWHPDGARAVPYQVFAPVLPMQIKIGYWLTDLPRRKMGNFVYLPGSHREQYMDHYDTHDDVAGQQILQVSAGTITIMFHSLWHRVEPNESDVSRVNIFLAYCPSWIVSADRFQSDPAWLKTLNREQRIIMRSYSHAYSNAKPPAEDFPLFLDRATGADRDADCYPEHVQRHRRKRRVWAEAH